MKILLYPILFLFTVPAYAICQSQLKQGIENTDLAKSCAQEWLDLWTLSTADKNFLSGSFEVLAVLSNETKRFSGAFGKEATGPLGILPEMGFYLMRYKSWNLKVTEAVPFGKNGFASQYRGTVTTWKGKKLKAWGSDWITFDNDGKFKTWAGYYNDENSIPE